MTFDECKKIMARCRMGEKRLGGRNTVLYKVDEHSFAVCYHNTEVVIIHDDGSYTLQTGGYKSMTTKARINEYSPAGIQQRKFEWYLDGKYFKSGCRVDSNGHLIEDLQEYHRNIGYIHAEPYSSPLFGSRSDGVPV